MKPETKKSFLQGISDAWSYPNFDDNTNFWDMLSYSWANNGANFIQGLPRFIAESGLSLGSNWLAGLIGNKLDFNSYRQKADYQFMLSEQMAQNAYNRQLDFWNKQNAYNTPAAMVGRMADAGLNPAQSITPQPAGGLSSVSTPMPSASSSRPNIEGGLKSFGEILTAVKNMGLLDKETELKAKELVSKQLDNDLKALAKASGFSDAMIKEMDRRAQWEATYGDDVPIPDNPYVSELFPQSIVRNPRIQSYRQGESNIRATDQGVTESQNRVTAANAYLELERELQPLRVDALTAQTEKDRAQAFEAYRQAFVHKVNAFAIRNRDNREGAAHSLEQVARRYANSLGATEVQQAELKYFIDDMWLNPDWNDAGRLIMDFIHNNLRLSGNAGATKVVK